jgi:hypothetical protein
MSAMEDNRIETLDDADLENVSGGAGISISIDGSGVSLAGPLGEVHVPNPLSIAGKVVGGTLQAAGAVLEGAGHVLGKIGGHFH